MSTVTVLETNKLFLQEKVSPSIKLQVSNDNNINSYDLMHPNVFVGWIPPKGYLPAGISRAIPCIIVGMDEAGDDGESEEIKLRLSFVVYNPGLHEPEGEGIKFTPDMEGYKDLLNLTDRTKAELLTQHIINNRFIIQDPVKWGMYDEQPEGYWCGWLTYSVKKAPYPRAEIEKLLI